MKYSPDRPISTNFAMNHHLVVLHWFFPKPKATSKKYVQRNIAAVWGCASFARRSYPAGLKRHRPIGELKQAKILIGWEAHIWEGFISSLFQHVYLFSSWWVSFCFSKFLFYILWFSGKYTSLTNQKKLKNWCDSELKLHCGDLLVIWKGTGRFFNVEGEVYYLCAREDSI